MNKEPLYQEWGHKLIPSSYGELNGKKRYYRVFYGTVHWHTADPENIHKACTVFVQYGATEDFEQARRKGEIRENYPCHIIEQDMDSVMAAMKELRERRY
ncbi:hypothetical protein B0I26_1392 [Anoxybacillus vitaminiphilus]|uniref:Uncharacterized protein n=1 Tax=Paranoxybacillus vitaminiphilus TaxID=581036 RepID=A0A327Y6E1_9BACL|nr:hypothetical protein [Anoxybacillus vitaminiphilus]RAK14019.1 hypothetical protein B0I26_1392 [Anoxybacillus vitaminiphilus]